MVINYLGLDYGSKRVGLATGNDQARLATPLSTLPNGDLLMSQLAALCKQEAIDQIVIGLPRGLDGQMTEQSELITLFAKHAHERLRLPVHLQDEAVTSEVAEEHLKASGRNYRKSDIDQVAAALILQDFLNNL